MTENEKYLITILKACPDANTKAVILQSYIAEFGPVSDEAGEYIRDIL